MNEKIKNNRAAFLRTFMIQGKRPRESMSVIHTGLPPSAFDHHEIYSTPSGQTLIVCSNYVKEPPPSLGMFEIPPIYSARARTFVGVFENRYAFIRAMNEIKRQRLA